MSPNSPTAIRPFADCQKRGASPVAVEGPQTCVDLGSAAVQALDEPGAREETAPDARHEDDETAVLPAHHHRRDRRARDGHRHHRDQARGLEALVAGQQEHSEDDERDLRDREGLTQIVVSSETDMAAHAKAKNIRGEFVIGIRGEVVSRAEGTHNAKLATARFYADQVLVQAPALRDTVVNGAARVMALSEDQFLAA